MQNDIYMKQARDWAFALYHVAIAVIATGVNFRYGVLYIVLLATCLALSLIASYTSTRARKRKG